MYVQHSYRLAICLINLLKANHEFMYNNNIIYVGDHNQITPQTPHYLNIYTYLKLLPASMSVFLSILVPSFI